MSLDLTARTKVYAASYILKRPLDVFLGILLSCAAAPVAAVIAALIYFQGDGPILFWQLRSGRYGRPFRVAKFRTMNERTDSCGRLLPDMQRITSVGRVLRASGLDELPQLFHVVCGEMSLVGPRPLLSKYEALYSAREEQRLNVRPGITGVAQIKGRNGLTWRRKLACDIWYVTHVSLSVDLWVLVMTVPALLFSGRTNHSDETTMPEFGERRRSRTLILK